MKKHTFIILIITCLLLLVFLGNQYNSKERKVKILLSTYDVNEKFPALIANEIIKYGNENNIEVHYKDGKGSRENQITDLLAAKNNGYDGIICIPLDDGVASKISNEVNGIPIVFVNNNPGEEILKKDKIIYVGSKEEEAAEFQAEYICQKFYNKPNLNIVIFEGAQGHDATLRRTKAFKNYLSERNINATYVFEDIANWKTFDAYKKFNIFLRTNQPFDCVVCNNDAMALGVCESYKENNIEFDEHPILGIDATCEGIESIRNNEMKLTVYQSAVNEGKYSIDAIKLMLEGKSIDKFTYTDKECKNIWIPLKKVTSDNVDNIN